MRERARGQERVRERERESNKRETEKERGGRIKSTVVGVMIVKVYNITIYKK